MSSSRQFLSSALRQSRAAGQRTAQFSTTSPAAAIRDIPTTSFQNAPRTNNNHTNNNSSSGSNQYKSDMFNLLNSGSGSRGGGRNNSSSFNDAGHSTYYNSQKVQEMLQSEVTAANYMKQMKRQWSNGDVYAPRDLSAYEMKGGRQGKWTPPADAVDQLGFSPLDNYRNFSLVSDYMTAFGRIKHSNQTGLKPVNQRKIAKMVRRAIGLGIHPSVHKHPEILKQSTGRHLLPLVVPKGREANKTKNFDGEDEH
ncbi:hypothetical protein SMACR_02695 [Sordaria macrospora]|uniref:Small ribosomal subunit protein bS18m n=2 Tax=Sordaria macrospora TaxID=5147 RepID=F7VX74_SORMK|nr:uncharacterized protein SMAC_02695 [Sordaria macrospora k-hell]KAA8636367.1 hypothetical protein SMACR_02695 [Sordaria macrospora]KAH7633081.1 hypothetical protein B0T09DRAFT_332815 [Sordaria sp. MPI-SDFR-AT-0083]WPJ60476.1 hypothetical protein SMAC4_02695 [Sordaria macrospora]CCC10116.1 unnamed protein product [Sordaria macrospora k-hell]